MLNLNQINYYHELYKIPLIKVNSIYEWTGKGMNINKILEFDSKDMISNMFHNIVHYLLCPDQYLKHLVFALGQVSGMKSKFYIIIDDDERDIFFEESCSSALGILLMEHHNFKSIETIKDHAWFEGDETDIDNFLFFAKKSIEASKLNLKYIFPVIKNNFKILSRTY